MVAPTRSQPALPADLEISPRSRKFYDGTYKWDSDGFTDERGGRDVLQRNIGLYLTGVQYIVNSTAIILQRALPRRCLPCSPMTMKMETIWKS